MVSQRGLTHIIASLDLLQRELVDGSVFISGLAQGGSAIVAGAYLSAACSGRPHRNTTHYLPVSIKSGLNRSLLSAPVLHAFDLFLTTAEEARQID